MAKTIVLLRAVNVGGRNRLSMSDLRKTLEDAGMKDVRTLLQSGNVVLQSDHKGTRLEELLEQVISATVITRAAKEWHEIIADNPFKHEAESNPAKLAVMFLKEKSDATVTHNGPEKIIAASKHLYIYYPNGIGHSKLTGSSIERTLKTKGTARNWNTILKLKEMI